MIELYRPIFTVEHIRSELEKQLEAYQQSVANGEVADKRKVFASRIIELEKRLINMQETRRLFLNFSGN
jgi:hypothetical protein